MSNLRLDLDGQLDNLELEWRLAYDASIVARAKYQELAARGSAGAELLDLARERLERSEARKSRVMARIERLEHRLPGQQG
jgi:hypothetical protein